MGSPRTIEWRASYQLGIGSGGYFKAFYNLITSLGHFNFALSERISSGSPYSISWTIEGRGTERADMRFETNPGINWNITMFSKLDLFVELDIINMFLLDAEQHAHIIEYLLNSNDLPAVP